MRLVDIQELINWRLWMKFKVIESESVGKSSMEFTIEYLQYPDEVLSIFQYMDLNGFLEIIDLNHMADNHDVNNRLDKK